MARLTKTEWQELNHHFKRSEGCDTLECCSCKKPIVCFKQWWQQVSMEYGEWDCYCARCALYQIHLFDDFDEDLMLGLFSGDPQDDRLQQRREAMPTLPSPALPDRRARMARDKQSDLLPDVFDRRNP